MSVVGLLALLALGLAIAITLGAWITGHHLRRPPRKTYGWALARNLPGDPSELADSLHFDSLELDLRGDDPELRNLGHSPVWDIEGGDANGPVIIWTPGWGDSRVGSLARVRHLAPLAKRVIAWDPPGQGDAPGLWPMAVREDRLLVDLARWAHETHATPIVLAGSSMGAGLSMVAAVTLQESSSVPVVGVIAEAPYCLPKIPASMYLRAVGHPHTWNIEIVYGLMGMRLGAGANWEKAHAGRGFDRAQWAASLQCSLLVLHGDLDVISPPEDGQRIAEAASQSELVLIEGGGHNDLWLKPEFERECVAAVGRFVRRLAPSPLAGEGGREADG
ncbi:MAG: alpha/beta hydrolase [Phycisphaerales bacterium JB065]